MVVDWLYLVVKQIQMTTPPPPFLALVALYFSSCNAVLHISCAAQEPLQIQLQQQIQIQKSKATQKNSCTNGNPLSPSLPPQLAYLLHSFLNYSPSSHWCPRNAIKAQHYTHNICKIFVSQDCLLLQNSMTSPQKIPLENFFWENPLRLCS